MAAELKLTQKQIQVIAVVALVVVGGGYFYWNYLLAPELKAIKENNEKLNDLQGKIASAEREARRLPALRDERERLTNELVKLEKQLPKDKDVPNIIRVLTREALQENLEFGSFSPKPAQQNQYFEALPFDMTMSGTLSSLARFFTALGQHERIFKFMNVRLTPKTSEVEGTILLGINFSVETYAYTGGS